MLKLIKIIFNQRRFVEYLSIIFIAFGINLFTEGSSTKYDLVAGFTMLITSIVLLELKRRMETIFEQAEDEDDFANDFKNNWKCKINFHLAYLSICACLFLILKKFFIK